MGALGLQTLEGLGLRRFDVVQFRLSGGLTGSVHPAAGIRRKNASGRG